VNHHFLLGSLHGFTPANTAQWFVAACILGFVAGLYLRSLAWVYRGARERLPLRWTAVAATALAGLSWPASLLLVRIIQPPTALRRPRRPLGRRFWMATAVLASAAGACAILDWRGALGLAFMLALALCGALIATILASLAIVVAIGNYMGAIPGVIAWGIIALGMLVFVIWNERRVMTTPARGPRAPG